jgi:acyl carrier protein
MDETSIRGEVLAVLRAIAPEIDAARIDAAKPLRFQIDLDSMDWLNVLVGLQEKFGVPIPEADYGKVTSLDGIVAYLGAGLAQRAGG